MSKTPTSLTHTPYSKREKEKKYLKCEGVSAIDYARRKLCAAPGQLACQLCQIGCMRRCIGHHQKMIRRAFIYANGAPADARVDDLVLSETRQARALALEQDGARRASFRREHQARLVAGKPRANAPNLRRMTVGRRSHLRTVATSEPLILLANFRRFQTHQPTFYEQLESTPHCRMEDLPALAHPGKPAST